MSEKIIDTVGAEQIDMSMLDDLLADMPLDEPIEGLVEETIDETLEVSAEDESAAIAELELADEKAAVYAEADASGEVVTEEPPRFDPEGDVAVPAPKAAKAPKEKKAKAPAAPRMTVEALPVDAFVLTTDDVEDLEANKAAVIAKRPAQKKVVEKFDNLLLSVAAGKLPSTFTVDCYRVLKAKGSVTTAELVAALMSTAKKTASEASYSKGTAAAQTGQIMSLFPALKIATREGNKITLNPDSTLAAALDAMLGL